MGTMPFIIRCEILHTPVFMIGIHIILHEADLKATKRLQWAEFDVHGFRELFEICALLQDLFAVLAHVVCIPTEGTAVCGMENALLR